MNILLKTFVTVALVASFSACKLIVTSTEGGTVLSASGDYCSESSPCEYDGADIGDTFTAIAEPGYKFAGWDGWSGSRNSVVYIPYLPSELIGLDNITMLIANFSLDDGRYAIGDTGPAGGIVFYVDDTGKHGLEAAPVDQVDQPAWSGGPLGVEWGCNYDGIPGALGLVIGTGEQNTSDILARGCIEEFSGPIAVELVDAYSLNGFEDWFLPSLDELTALYSAKDVVRGFGEPVYWSSSQIDPKTSVYIDAAAWAVSFYSGVREFGFRNHPLGVRAVRDF